MENPWTEIQERPIDDENKLIPDYYIDRPVYPQFQGIKFQPTPEYKPKEPGVDVETQVVDHELFDYYLEVEPILQVLVGRTIEQSRIELCEDYERHQEMLHRVTIKLWCQKLIDGIRKEEKRRIDGYSKKRGPLFKKTSRKAKKRASTQN